MDLTNLNFNITEADRENVIEGYRGEMPPANTVLAGLLESLFLTVTAANEPMIKVVYKATGGMYDGYPGWDNVTIKSSAAFKWGTLLDILGVSVEDLKKRMKVDTKETAVGYRIERIGKWTAETETPVQFIVAYKKDDDGNRQAYVRDAWRPES